MIFNKLISMFVFYSYRTNLTATTSRRSIILTNHNNMLRNCLFCFDTSLVLCRFLFVGTFDLNSETTEQSVSASRNRPAGFESSTGRVGYLSRYFRIVTMLYFFLFQNHHLCWRVVSPVSDPSVTRGKLLGVSVRFPRPTL